MTSVEIFSKLSEHMLQGIMFHSQMTDYYDFLGLRGYSLCQEYHFLEETMSYRSLNRYCIQHNSCLIPEAQIENESIIPSSWYSHTREDVDTGTKKNAIKSGLMKWVDWEKSTKKFYEEMYQEAMSQNLVTTALFIQHIIEDVDWELCDANFELISKESFGYDMSLILDEQNSYYEKYKRKLRCLYESCRD